MNEQRITLDTTKRVAPRPLVRVRRWDRNGTTVVATLESGGSAADVSGMVPYLVLGLSDGTMSKTEGTLSGSVATFALNEEDIGECEVDTAFVRLEADGRAYSTGRFAVMIEDGARHE